MYNEVFYSLQEPMYKTSTMEKLLGGAYNLKEFDDGWYSGRQWESQRTII